MVRLPPPDPSDDVELRDDPRVLDIESEAAAELIAALRSGTARRVLAALQEEPATPSRIASIVDTSVQNVHYHLENLLEADAVRVASTHYSEKGREMNRYAPTLQSLVLLAGGDEDGGHRGGDGGGDDGRQGSGGREERDDRRRPPTDDP